MLHNFPYRSVIFAPLAMTVFVTGAAYVMGKAVNGPASGAASAAVAFVIAGTWLCGAALGICDRVAMRTLELQQARFEAGAPKPTTFRYEQVAEVVTLQESPTSTRRVHLPETIAHAQLEQFAHNVLRAHMAITTRNCAGRGRTFSRQQYDDLLAVMRANDLVEQRNANRAGGVDLTVLGKQFLLQYLPPSARAQVRYENHMTGARAIDART